MGEKSPLLQTLEEMFTLKTAYNVQRVNLNKVLVYFEKLRYL